MGYNMIHGNAKLRLENRRRDTATDRGSIIPTYLIPKLWLTTGAVQHNENYNNDTYDLAYSFGVIRLDVLYIDRDDETIDLDTPAKIYIPIEVDDSVQLLHLSRWGRSSREGYWKNIKLRDVADLKTFDSKYVVFKYSDNTLSRYANSAIRAILNKDILNTPLLSVITEPRFGINGSNDGISYVIHQPSVEDPKFFTSRYGWLTEPTGADVIDRALAGIDQTKLDRDTLDEIEMGKAMMVAQRNSKSRDVVNTRLALKEHLDNPNLRVYDNVGGYAKAVVWLGEHRETKEVKVIDTVQACTENDSRYYTVDPDYEVIAAIPVHYKGLSEIHLFTIKVESLNKILSAKAEFISVRSNVDFKDQLANGKYQIVIVDGRDVGIMCLDKSQAETEAEKAFMGIYINKFVENALAKQLDDQENF